MIIEEHNLPSACYKAKNGLARYMTELPRGVVVHYTSGRWEFPDDIYNPEKILTEILIPERLSYHALILRDGTIWELMPKHYQAFHAGYSRMLGHDFCNAFCYGLAFISTGRPEAGHAVAYTDAQLLNAATYIAHVLKIHNLDRIQGHDQVRTSWNARYPEKKQPDKPDPGPNFPWARFKGAVASMLNRGPNSETGYGIEEDAT